MRDMDAEIIQKALVHIIQELRAISIQLEEIDEKLSKKAAQPRRKKPKAQPQTSNSDK